MKTKYAKGFSLIELMIAITVGLFLVAAVSILFLNTKKSYLAQDANARIQETSRFALDLLGRQIRASGFPLIKFDLLSPTNLFATPSSSEVFAGKPIEGTDGGTGSDTLTLSFDSTVDCLGNAVSPRAVNLFQVNASKQLECLGNGTANPGVILDDVEDMQVLYGVSSGGASFSVVSWLAANSVADFKTVRAVRVCLLLRARGDVDKRALELGSKQSYADCNGASKEASDGYIRRAFTMTTDIRNRLP